MKIKMLTLMAGPNGTFSPGQEIDIENKAAKALIAGGYAEAVRSAVKSAEKPAEKPADKPAEEPAPPVKRQEEPKTATRKPTEKAVKHHGGD